jgi:hypothetical protein
MGAGRVGPVVFVVVWSCGRVVLLVPWLTSYAGQDPGRGREEAAVSSPSGLARVGVGFVSTPENARATELQTSGGEKGEAGRRARVRQGAGSGMCLVWCKKGSQKGTPKQQQSRQATGQSKRLQNIRYFWNRPPTSRWLRALCAGCGRERQKDTETRNRESGIGGQEVEKLPSTKGGRSVVGRSWS